MTTPVSNPSYHPLVPGVGVRRSSRTATGTALSLLAAVIVTGPGCLLAVYLAPQNMRTPIAWSGGVTAVLLTAAVTAAAFVYFTARDLEAVIVTRDEELASQREQNVLLADEAVPAVVGRLRDGASVSTALAAAPPLQDAAHRRVLASLAKEVHRGEGMRSAAMAACANAAGRVQALATGMAADLRDMQHRHSGEDVLGDLLHLDHRTAQAGRMADSIALLTGARSGRRWAKPIVMESILRGAMGRIGGYQRIRLHSASEVSVVGHAAEGVMHALAELMDNAANFSPPTSEVHVYVEEVATGVVITIEDGGLVMGEVALRRAEQAVSAESFDLSSLSGTRLGLPVVGRLAQKHGLSVSFRPSAHGGTGVLVMIPQTLVTETRRESGSPATSQQPPRNAPLGGTAPANSRATPAPSEDTVSRPQSVAPDGAGEHEGLPRRRPVPQQRTPEPAPEHTSPPARQQAPAQPPERPGAEQEPGVEYGESGLPQRRRGRTLAAAHQRTQDARPEQVPGKRRTAEQSGSRLGAFRKAVQGGTGPSGEQGTGISADRDTTADRAASTGHGGPTDRPAPPDPHSETENDDRAGNRTSPTPFRSASPSSSRPEDDTE